MDPGIIDPAKSWKGFDKIKHIFIFGASNSSVGFPPRCPEPTETNPFGVEWPGLTWAENQPVWIGHLIDKFISPDQTVLVYNYAVGGHRVSEVVKQFEDWFMEGPGRKKGRKWKSEDALFITWIGGNDITCSIDIEKTLNTLFEVQDELYDIGARNLLFCTVTPGPNPQSPSKISERRSIWNSTLRIKVTSFADSPEHEGSTAFLFDAHGIVSQILADPLSFGFNAVPNVVVGEEYDGVIWVDHCHWTTTVHKIVAKEIACFLYGREVEERESRYKVAREEEDDIVFG